MCVFVCARGRTDAWTHWRMCSLRVLPPESACYAQLQHTNGGGRRPLSQLHLQTQRHHLACTQWGHQGKGQQQHIHVHPNTSNELILSLINNKKKKHFTPQVLNEMTDLLSSCRNYDNYRQAYNKCTGFKIPIMGVHLKDLISVNEAMSDYVEDNKVNVQKLHALYSHINELIQLQQIPPKLDANKDLVHLLTVVFFFFYLKLSWSFMWFTTLYWTQAQMQMSMLEHVDCPRLCGCDENLWVCGRQTECEWERVEIDVLLCYLCVRRLNARMPVKR